MNIKQDPLSHYVELIRNGTLFALTRYGDGEFASIFGEEGENCDGHTYFPQMGLDLTNTLVPPAGDYYYGLVRIAQKVYGDDLQQKIDKRLGNLRGLVGAAAHEAALANDADRLLQAQYKLRHMGREWVDGTVFVDASRDGELFPLVKALRGRYILYIGPEFLKPIRQKVFEWVVWVPVPEKNAYLYCDFIKAQVRYYLDSYDDFIDLVGFSCGPVAEILIHDLWGDYDVSMIDFGSLWDIYVGRKSRKYHHQMDWDMLIPKNLGEDNG